MTAAFEPGEPGVPGAGFGIFRLVPVRPKTCAAPSSTSESLVSVICEPALAVACGGHVGRALRQYGPAQVQRLVGRDRLDQPVELGTVERGALAGEARRVRERPLGQLRRVDRHLDGRTDRTDL